MSLLLRGGLLNKNSPHNKLLFYNNNNKVNNTISSYKESAMMCRLATVDQLKFLFLFVLNSSAAALATQANRGNRYFSSAAAAADTSDHRLATPSETESTIANGHINFRMARRSDIPSIQRCNLATLPENYNSNFYLHHLRSWPELALVMEYVPSPADRRNNDHPNGYHHPGDDYYSHTDIPFNYDDVSSSRGSGNEFSNYNPSSRRDDEAMVIGYVLGKVDEVPISPSAQPPQPRIPAPKNIPRSRIPPPDEHNYGIYPPYSRNYNQPRTEMLGHVTSLAILHNYRRKGLAAQLMNQLHYHMHSHYNADAVGLHVRVSNKAATKLYIQNMGYVISDVIKGYYQDGEDAYFMRKEFIQNHHHAYQESSTMSPPPRGIRKIFWPRSKNIRNELILPRRIELCDPQQQHNNVRNVDRRNHQQHGNDYRRGTLSFVSNDTMYYQYDSE